MVRLKARKRGQMEIMGLMVIIILIIVGVLFAIKFVVLKKPTDIKKTYTQTQLASNMGTALLQTETKNCRGTTITELLTDWAEWPGQYGTITCGNYKKAGIYANETIANLLNQTFDYWRIKYQIKGYTTKGVGQELFKFNNLGCTDNVPGESELFFLPTDRGVLTVKFFICS